jgi:hypothetical protein
LYWNFVAQEVERRIESLMQVCQRPVLIVVRPREIPEVTDDLLHPPDPLLRFGDQVEHVYAHVVEIQTASNGAEFVPRSTIRSFGALCVLVRGDEARDIAQIIRKRAEVRLNVA